MASLQIPMVSRNENWQRLEQKWIEAKAIWDDPVRLAFEEHTWTQLEQQWHKTQVELERLWQLVNQAQRQVR